MKYIEIKFLDIPFRNLTLMNELRSILDKDNQYYELSFYDRTELIPTDPPSVYKFQFIPDYHPKCTGCKKRETCVIDIDEQREIIQDYYDPDDPATIAELITMAIEDGCSEWEASE
jgi:hypothetical protein